MAAPFRTVSDPGSLGRLLLPAILVGAVALVVSREVATARLDFALAAVSGVAVFILVFLKTELGVHLVILSMLLSPEFSLGGAIAENRGIVFRSEDFLLGVIALSWFAKTAVNKELGLVRQTPLNRPILAYVLSAAIATVLGLLAGNVHGVSGFLYVIKYIEYFFVYYMVVNNVGSRAQVRRLVLVAFATAAIVSVIGIGQIPSGLRVSAPFEGERGEPNTLGGYLLLMMSLLVGIGVESRRPKIRAVAFALCALMTLPFLYTLSRASYLGLIPALGVLAVLSTRRRLMLAVVTVFLVASPLAVSLVPNPVVKRVQYTFQPEERAATVRLGRVALDPSTSARFLSFAQAIEGWRARPVFGWGVTGFGFMDAQYARTLAETGLVGLFAFLWLLASVFRLGTSAFHALADPEERGLALGFIAGTAGLLTHAIGSNTFIIVRIMEPFWLFAGIVALLPTLRTSGEPPASAGARGPALAAVARAGGR